MEQTHAFVYLPIQGGDYALLFKEALLDEFPCSGSKKALSLSYLIVSNKEKKTLGKYTAFH